MKKKLVMKKWVEVVLLVMSFICLLVAMSDYDNTITFAIFHIIAGVVLILIGMMFMSYGRSDD